MRVHFAQPDNSIDDDEFKDMPDLNSVSDDEDEDENEDAYATPTYTYVPRNVHPNYETDDDNDDIRDDDHPDYNNAAQPVALDFNSTTKVATELSSDVCAQEGKE